MTVLMGERLGSGAHRSGIEPLLDYAAATSDGHGGTMLDDRAVRLQFADALADEQGERFFQARLRTMVSRGENPGALAGMVKIAYAGRYQRTNGLALELDRKSLVLGKRVSVIVDHGGPRVFKTKKIKYKYLIK